MKSTFLLIFVHLLVFHSSQNELEEEEVSEEVCNHMQDFLCSTSTQRIQLDNEVIDHDIGGNLQDQFNSVYHDASAD